MQINSESVDCIMRLRNRCSTYEVPAKHFFVVIRVDDLMADAESIGSFHGLYCASHGFNDFAGLVVNNPEFPG